MKQNLYTRLSGLKRLTISDYVVLAAVFLIINLMLFPLLSNGKSMLLEEVPIVEPIIEPEPVQIALVIIGAGTVFVKVEITAYNAEKCQTDSTPNITASNKRVREGICALSRDLENAFNLKFGDVIGLEIDGKIRHFVFEDRMNRRIVRTVDIFMKSKSEALSFGRRDGYMFPASQTNFRSLEIREEVKVCDE